MCLRALICDFVTMDGVVKAAELGLAACGCYIAYRGLMTWREQVIETPKIELAREIVEQFYNMKDLIASARCPFISFSPDEVRKYYEKNDLTEYQCGLAYRLMVLDKSIDQITTFQKLRNKAKIFYSKEIENCFLETNKIINHFKHACKAMMDETYNQSLIDGHGKGLIEEFHDKIYDIGDKDTTNIKLKKIIDEVEYNLKPIYEAKKVKWEKLKQKELKND